MTSSSSMMSGFIASARTIATRCCWPPDSRSGTASRLSASPNRASSSIACASASARGTLQDAARRQGDVVQHGHVREEVERLEDDPDPATDPVDVDALGRDLLAADDDPAGIDGLEQVDAAQERGLARPRRPDQADDLVLGDGQVDAAQDLERAERLVQPLDPERLGRSSADPLQAAPGHAPPVRCATSQSVNRASGMVNDHEHERHPEERGPVEGRLLLDAGRPEDLDDPDERDEDRVLLEPDEVVEQRGDDPSDGLRAG